MMERPDDGDVIDRLATDCPRCRGEMSTLAAACPRCRDEMGALANTCPSCRPTRFRVQMPAEGESRRSVGGWNWGAFFWTWIWGLKHRVYWPLASIAFGLGWLAVGIASGLLIWIPFVVCGPIFQFVTAVILGNTGNTLALNSGRFRSGREFCASQRVWAITGAIAWAVLVALIAVFFHSLKGYC